MLGARSISYRKLSYFFIVWCSCWILLQTIALESTFHFGWKVSVLDSAVTNLIIAFAAYDMILVMKYYRPRQVVRLGMSIVLAFTSIYAIHYILGLVINEPPRYSQFLEDSHFIRGLYIWLMIALATALTGLWSSGVEKQDAYNRSVAAEKLAREAELARLRQQLQPHFLFNSLNSISALAGSRPEEARKMIHQLSDFFRGTLRKDDQQLVCFSEELQHLSLYLDIEKVRFGHRLKTEIHCDPAAMAMKVPCLLLQPVVENAIKFGLYDTLGETIIRMSVVAETNYLAVKVENPFDPQSAARRPGTGFGLQSIRRRLYLLYARNDLLTTAHGDKTFITTVRIPQSV